jgi:hypothetical protein
MLVLEIVLAFRLKVGFEAEDEAEASEWLVVVEVDGVDVREERVELDESRSEWARVYLVVVISSSSGVRKETRFSAGNMGRFEAILRGIIERAGLLERIEARLWGCL